MRFIGYEDWIPPFSEQDPFAELLDNILQREVLSMSPVCLVVGVLVFDVADEHPRGLVPSFEMPTRQRHETRIDIKMRIVNVLFGYVADALIFNTR